MTSINERAIRRRIKQAKIALRPACSQDALKTSRDRRTQCDACADHRRGEGDVALSGRAVVAVTNLDT